MCIDKFEDDYSFLSNFEPVRVVWGDRAYGSSEAAYQSAKTLDMSVRDEFVNITPGDSKKLGRMVTLRPDWETIKDSIMYEIVYAKFSGNQELRRKLICTGHKELIEGNDWGDKYWGVFKGKGKNKLGLTLMRVRTILREEYGGCTSECD